VILFIYGAVKLVKEAAMDFENEINDLPEISNEELDGKLVENLPEKSELIKQFIDDIHQKIEETKSHITLVVDRFEGDIAVCEDRETEEITNIDISELPENVQEGDVLKLNNGKYEIDEQTKLEIEERIKNKIKNLFEETE